MAVQFLILAYGSAFQPQMPLTLTIFTPVYLIGGVAILGACASLCSKFGQMIYGTAIVVVRPKPTTNEVSQRAQNKDFANADPRADSSLNMLNEDQDSSNQSKFIKEEQPVDQFQDETASVGAKKSVGILQRTNGLPPLVQGTPQTIGTQVSITKKPEVTSRLTASVKGHLYFMLFIFGMGFVAMLIMRFTPNYRKDDKRVLLSSFLGFMVLQCIAFLIVGIKMRSTIL